MSELSEDFAFPKRNRMPLSEEVASYIRDSIMSGRFRGGDYVRIDTMAAGLEMSATPVREAMLSLRAEGFLELDKNKGFRVAGLSEVDVRDIYDLHANIAGELAARAAPRMSPVLISKLEGLQESMAKSSRRKDWDRVEELNFQFHRLIYAFAQSPKLSRLLGILIHYTPRHFFADIKGWPEASINDHAVIIEALRAKNPKKARETVAEHIENARDLLIANLKSKGFWDAPEKVEAKKARG